MGKLRLTLTSLLFYVVIFLSCFLAENFAFYNANPLGGLNRSSLLLVAFLIILLLGFYYYLEHRKNGLRFDKVLLPLSSLCFLLMSITIIWQKNLQSVDKLIIVMQAFIWMVVLYSILFTNNRHNSVHNVFTLFALTHLLFMLICVFIDLFVEGKSFVAIFDGTYSESGFRFVIYNPNVWGMMLLLGQLTSYALSIKKFNIMYYLISIVFFLFNIMTTCTTTVFIGGILLILYTVYEALYIYQSDKKKAIVLLSSFFGSIALIALVSVLLYQLHVAGFVNLWDFLFNRTFVKDYSTFTNRTFIWKEVFNILLKNPRDFIFGLGYKNADLILESKIGFRSAHNAFVEVFLRHGLIGELIYLSAIGLFVYSIVQLFKQKQYRFAIMSSCLFLALLIHGCMESTVFFTPNIQGSYILIAFYLPAVSTLQKKKFNQLKESNVISKEPLSIDGKNILQGVLSILLGLAISLFASCFIDSANNQNTSLIFLIIGLSLMVLIILITLMFYLFVFKEKMGSLLKEGLLRLVVDNFFPIMITMTLGLSFVYLIKQYADINAFSSVVVCTIIFTIYLLTITLIQNKNRKEFVDYCNCNYFTLLSRFTIE